jgi:hypothetical protein
MSYSARLPVHYWIVEKTIRQLTSTKTGLLDLLSSRAFFDSLPSGEMYNLTKVSIRRSTMRWVPF